MILNNIKTPNQLMEYMQNNLQYGFVAKNKIYLDNNPNFQKDMDKYYKLSSPARLIKSGYGVCWDFCELQRAFFKANNIPYECFFIESFKNRVEGGPTHSFTLFYANGKCYWFEFSWQSNRGIWQFENKQQALKKIIRLHKQAYNTPICKLYNLTKPKANLNTFEYVEHCLNCPPVELTV